MRHADAAAAEAFGIEPVQLMEVAGVQIARLVQAWLARGGGKRVTAVCGAGNNGGDALVAVRYLAQRGFDVEAWVIRPRGGSTLMARHLQTAQRLGIPVREADADRLELEADVLLDGLLGVGVQLPLRSPAASIIAAMNAVRAPIIAVDVPSGLDADSGDGSADCVRAAATVTLALPKPALLHTPAVGRLFLADIGLPAALFAPQDARVRALFEAGDLIELV